MKNNFKKQNTDDLRYIESEEKFLNYSFDVFKKYFNSDRELFNLFYKSIGSKDKKNKFLKIASFYKFLVVDGKFIVQNKKSDSYIDYLDHTYKYIAIFSFIEDLCTSDKYKDFYSWLRSKKENIKFPINNTTELDNLHKRYLSVHGSTQKAVKFFEQQAISSDKRPCKALDPVDGWSPLGVLMGEICGFTASFKDILDDPRLGLELSEQLDNERKKHKQRWKTIPAEISSNELVKEFLSYLLQPGNKIASYLTIERWLRAVLDEHSSTKSLAYLFGGETRYEFGTRGCWYDSKGTFVQDVPLVIVGSSAECVGA